MIPSYFTVHKLNDCSGEILCSLDTGEGSDCFGHWVQECAMFLPDIVELKKSYNIKILLRYKRRFKTLILQEFGFTENDIIYSSNMNNNCMCHKWHTDEKTHRSFAAEHSWVIPSTSYSLFIQPHFMFLNATSRKTALFFSLLSKFKSFLQIPTNGEINKTIPFLYLIRSKKEFYKNPNQRTFINIDEVVSTCLKMGVKIVSVDDLTTIREQIDLVLSSKVIILEFGSALVNAAFFSNNSHIIILNNIPVGLDYINLMKHMMSISSTSWDILEPYNNDWMNFTIDTSKLSNLLSRYL